MDQTSITIATEIAKGLVGAGLGVAATVLTESFEKPLTKVLPVLGRLRALRIRQIERSLEALSDRLKRIEMTTDGERLLGFANMCFRYFEAGAKEHRDLKLRILAAACANTAESENHDSFDVQLEYFDLIERLQPFHIAILHHLSTHYTHPKPDGGHTHDTTAQFKELLKINFGLDEPKDLWLAKALLLLQHELCIVVSGGGMTIDEGTHTMRPLLPEELVQSGGLGLSNLGCRLLHYIQSALMDERKTAE